MPFVSFGQSRVGCIGTKYQNKRSNNIKFILILLCISIPSFIVYSQKTSNKIFDTVKEYARKNRQKELLPMQMLKSATEISYGFSNGSVSPEYAYKAKIIVTPKYVILNIINQSSLCFTKSCSLTIKQYSDFITSLYSLGIKKNTEDYIPIYRGGSSELTIQNGDRTLFKGVKEKDFITSKGQLSDPFLTLLDKEMRAVYDDPSSTFGTIIDIFPVDY